jgi:two-component system CheB/CheR fusion protein
MAQQMMDAERVKALWAAQDEGTAQLGLDIGGVVLWMSPRAAQVFGYSERQLLGQHVEGLFTSDDRRRRAEVHERLFAMTTGRCEDERWYPRSDGSLLWAGSVLTAVRAPGGDCVGFVKTLSDRTYQRTRIASLENRLKRLAQQERERDHYLESLVHRLANPLSTLTTVMAILRREPAPERRSQMLAAARRQLDALAALVDELGSLRAASPLQPPIAWRRIALHTLVREVVDELVGDATSRGVSVQMLAPDIPVWLDGEPGDLQEIVAELLRNGIDRTPCSGSVWVQATVDSADALVRVQDTGATMSHASERAIFELFTHAAEAPPRPACSSRVRPGLAAVRDRVWRHRGVVDARQSQGRGMVFTVRLPLRQGLERDVPGGAEAHSALPG